MSQHDLITDILRANLLESIEMPDTITIHKANVNLEPPFTPYSLKDFLKHERVYLRLWFSPKEDGKAWSVLFTDLARIKHPIEILFAGNEKRIICQLAVRSSQKEAVTHALRAHFPNIEVETAGEHCFTAFNASETSISLKDFFSFSPYWKPLIAQGDYAPLTSIMVALSQVKEGSLGWYQVILKGCTQPWRENIVNLMKAECNQEKAMQEKVRSHAFFAVSARAGIMGEGSPESFHLASLRHGHESLSYLSEKDYAQTGQEVRGMIEAGKVYRPGMILNAYEVTLLAGIGAEIIERQDIPLDRIEGWKAPEVHEDGLFLGWNTYCGNKRKVLLRDELRFQHMGVLGKTGTGKSTSLVHFFLDDARKGRSSFLLDLHERGAFFALENMPSHRIHDVVYLDFTDSEVVPAYNPFFFHPGEDIDKRTDDMIVAVRELYTLKEWGSVIEGVLYPLFYTLFCDPKLCLLDSKTLLSKCAEGDALREEILPKIDNEEVRAFWLDFPSIKQDVIDRAYGKLKKFLQSKKVSRIFSQRECRLPDFLSLIKERKLIIININTGKLGADNARVIGSMLLNHLYHSCMQRLDGTLDQTPFYVYVDEADQFKIKSLQDSLIHLRKCRVALCLGLQVSNISDSLRAALGTCASMMAFDLNFDEAHRAFKEFYGAVPVNDFMRKGRGKVFLKMDNVITHIETPIPKASEEDFSREMKSISKDLYYARVTQKPSGPAPIFEQAEAFDEL